MKRQLQMILTATSAVMLATPALAQSQASSLANSQAFTQADSNAESQNSTSANTANSTQAGGQPSTQSSVQPATQSQVRSGVMIPSPQFMPNLNGTGGQRVINSYNMQNYENNYTGSNGYVGTQRSAGPGPAGTGAGLQIKTYRR